MTYTVLVASIFISGRCFSSCCVGPPSYCQFPTSDGRFEEHPGEGQKLVATYNVYDTSSISGASAHAHTHVHQLAPRCLASTLVYCTDKEIAVFVSWSHQHSRWSLVGISWNASCAVGDFVEHLGLFFLFRWQSWIEIEYYSVAYFEHITEFHTLERWTFAKGGAHMRNVNARISDVSTKRVWAPPLAEA